MPSGHLLVIDDSPTVLKVVELTLTEAGYSVLTAADDDAGLADGARGAHRTGPHPAGWADPGRDAAEICRRFADDPSLRRRAGRGDGRPRAGG